jgi:ABC-2 type transport system ATP-binding protein
MREVGALLDAKAFHGKRTARKQLQWLAQPAGCRSAGRGASTRSRPATSVAGRRDRRVLPRRWRSGSASATALLGDPGTLLLDEPVNGLTPRASGGSGCWCAGWPPRGRTIVVSSHL